MCHFLHIVSLVLQYITGVMVWHIGVLASELDGLQNKLEKKTEEARQRTDSTVKTDQGVKDENNEANRQLKAELLEALDPTVTDKLEKKTEEAEEA